MFVRMWENRLPLSGDRTTATELVHPGGGPRPASCLHRRRAVAGRLLDDRRAAEQPDDDPARRACAPTFSRPTARAAGRTHWPRSVWTEKGVARVHDCRRAFDDLVDVDARGVPARSKLSPATTCSASSSGASAQRVGGHPGAARAFRRRAVRPRRAAHVHGGQGGHLTISGLRPRHRDLALDGETAIVASGLGDHGRDRSLRSRRRGEARTATQHLAGALTIVDTGGASVERVSAGAPTADAHGGVPRRSATRARALAPGAGALLRAARRCQPDRALLVNAAAATLEDNAITSSAAGMAPVKITRRTLISNVRIGYWQGNPAEVGSLRAQGVVKVWSENLLQFLTDPGLAPTWRKIFESLRETIAPPGRAGEVSAEDRRRIHRLIAEVVRQMLEPGATGPLSAALVREVAAWRRERERAPVQVAAAAGQGIVVGGGIATDVRVLHNTIKGAMEGIRVGVSARGARADRLIAFRVQIIGNTIWQRVPLDQLRRTRGSSSATRATRPSVTIRSFASARRAAATVTRGSRAPPKGSASGACRAARTGTCS